MIWVPGGTFLMGSADFYPEEGPVQAVGVDDFWMDVHAVTVADFARFVRETGYLTVAERSLDPSEYPGVLAEALVPGSLVFHPSSGPVDLRHPGNWWSWVPGASWSRPEGPESIVAGRDRHPVTHVAHEDADAYAAWAGKALPTEAEWERAARGGVEGAVYAWGDELQPAGQALANTWYGRFPWEHLGVAGPLGTSPVGSFPPNGYGLFDMTGNVWEWTDDFYTPSHRDLSPSPCCTPHNPRVDRVDAGDGGRPDAQIPRRVVKGGSHLCAPNYCLRYRPAARQAQSIDTSTAHIGFRCVAHVPPD